ncbi:hypothetical protein QE152_g39369 [Popillia japonica]|uniref:Uncharacterized protein n=1 Tax=Popillia japonica TaxID=7064 RepID=A0AAW1HUT5_POPJA
MNLRLVQLVLFLVLCLHLCKSFPANTNDNSNVSRSVFGQPFDEIIVESSLTVHRKNPRQERNNDLSKTVNGSNRNKRDVDVNTGELDIIEW